MSRLVRFLALLMLAISLVSPPCAAKDPSDIPEWETSEKLAAARAYYRVHAQALLGMPNASGLPTHCSRPCTARI